MELEFLSYIINTRYECLTMHHIISFKPQQFTDEKVKIFYTQSCVCKIKSLKSNNSNVFLLSNDLMVHCICGRKMTCFDDDATDFK